MLEKFLNKKVKIFIYNYGASPMATIDVKEGTVTALDENFIELDNDQVVAIKCIRSMRTA